MDKNFVLKKGMHSEKTISELEQTHPSYIEWAKKNAPNLLKENKKLEQKQSQSRIEPSENSEVKKAPFNQIWNF